MNYIKVFLLFLSCLALSEGSSQILPPTPDCIRGDTIYWSSASNSCGNFVSTDIFYSNNPAGPFTPLTSITDPNITSFYHPAMGDAYYYLQANHNCPGESPIPSDTINNLPPAITTLEKVTVQQDGVMVTWYDNFDQKTVGYIIYRSTQQGTIPIDTVFGVLQYLDQTALADQKSETYYVLAMDQCGNTGFFDMPHQTIFLSTEVNFCEQYIELNWNNYSGWQNGTESVQIWLGLDGAPLAFEHQVQLTDTLAYITGIDDDRQYCISITAKEIGRDVRAFSNTVCITSDVITPVDQLQIRNVSVNQNGDIEVSWRHNSNADIKTLELQRAVQNDPLGLIHDYSNSRPQQDDVQLEDSEVNTSSEIYYYQLKSMDECEETVISNEFYSVLLRARSGTEENELSWSPFKATSRVLAGYQVCRIDPNGNETSIYEGSGPELSLTDPIDPTETTEQCYVVKAFHTNASGLDTLVSRSNIACIKPEIGLYVPNAFAPNGVNNVFRPVPTLISAINNYHLQIFNRWGGLVFESGNIDFGWDGRQNGSLLEPGVFFYLITFDQPGGETEQKAGTVHLIR